MDRTGVRARRVTSRQDGATLCPSEHRFVEREIHVLPANVGTEWGADDPIVFSRGTRSPGSSGRVRFVRVAT
jgi:hypothetical protein